MHFLVADDDTMCRMVLQAMLEKCGHVVTTVTGGKELIETFEIGLFDAIITDISMPEVTGIDAAKAIRQKDPKIAIIASTASEHDDLGEYFNLEISKPIHFKCIQALASYFTTQKETI